MHTRKQAYKWLCFTSCIVTETCSFLVGICLGGATYVTAEGVAIFTVHFWGYACPNIITIALWGNGSCAMSFLTACSGSGFDIVILGITVIFGVGEHLSVEGTWIEASSIHSSCCEP